MSRVEEIARAILDGSASLVEVRELATLTLSRAPARSLAPADAQRVPESIIRTLAVTHGCHPHSIRKRLGGSRIKGIAGERVELCVRDARALGYQVCDLEGLRT